MQLDVINSSAERPIFLIGAERSGTTLLRLMLSHHPKVAFHFESGFIVKPLLNGNGEPTGAQLRDYHEWLRHSSAFNSSGFVIDTSLPYRELVRSFLRQKAILTGKAIVGMTIHKGFEHLPGVWPEGRYVHIVRDGRDVASSSVKMGWYGNAWAATERWKQAIASYDRLLSLVPHKNIIEVKFERLVSDSKEELTRISEFIDVSYDESYYDYANTGSYSLPGQSKAKNWRDHLGQLEIRLVEAEIGSLLQRFGYELSGLDHIEITDELRLQLTSENIRQRRKSSIKRYGFWILALNKLADKFSAAPIKRFAQAKISKISRSHIK